MQAEPTTDEYIDKSIRILNQMRRSLKKRRINVLRARIALCEITAASKYTTPAEPEPDECEVA